MKVMKGGISREIDPARLQEYLDKGYAPVPEKEKQKQKPPKKE